MDRVLEVAAKSPCAKRKVGAVIVDANDHIIAEGFNHLPANFIGTIKQCCEDSDGVTLPGVIHAEVHAIENLASLVFNGPITMYVSHEPCENCRKAMVDAGIRDFSVVEEFMKFDTDKLRYDLVPPSAFEGLAKVLTYGAKKYKPNNWKNTDDLDRYVAALYRHLEAWRKGEQCDEESGLKHLEHALTNVAFLLELDPDNLGTNLDKNKDI